MGKFYKPRWEVGPVTLGVEGDEARKLLLVIGLVVLVLLPFAFAL